MMWVCGRAVAVLAVVAAVVVADPSFRRRQRCQPKTKYVTQYQTKTEEVSTGL